MLLTCGLITATTVFAQQKTPTVIASAGDISITGKLYLEWTLGETFVETISSKDQLITQGFHQPLISVKDVSTFGARQQEELEVLIVPNPVQFMCRTVIKRESTTSLYLDLADIHGRKLYNTISNAKLDVIDLDFSSYSSGTYLLTVRDSKGGLFKTFKIIKAQ